MQLKDCNPYIRTAQIQAAVLERTGLRKAYDYRLFYILEGEGAILIESQRHPIRPDTLILLPPATAYDFLGKVKVVVLNFDITRRFSHRTSPLFPPAVSEFDERLLFETELLEGFERPLVLPMDAGTQENVLQIVYHSNSQEPYADARASARLKLLFADLLSLSDEPKNQMIEKILSYIRIHAPAIRSNEDVARAFGYHPVYLNDLIKRASGKTLHGVITEAKLQIACQWLSGTNETIEAIAYLSGFCSRAHFCTLFKKKLGKSPAEYRKRF